MPEPDPVALLRKAADAAKNAHAPYSRFLVGAALLTSDGRIFTGCNVENASFGLTNCAERTALFSAVAAGCRSFEAMAVVAHSGSKVIPYPCGACRQVMSEFCKPAMPVYVASTADVEAFERLTMGELLPHTFKL